MKIPLGASGEVGIMHCASGDIAPGTPTGGVLAFGSYSVLISGPTSVKEDCV
jgi:hypothetical protein